MGNNLTKAITKKLKVLAENLPVEKESKETTQIIHGSLILGKNPNATLPNGENVYADRWYNGKTNLPKENHLKRLCKAYKTGGVQMANDYINNIVEREKSKA